MNLRSIGGLFLLGAMTACGGGAAEGEECKTDADCADGLHCEAHDDHEGEEGEEHEEGEEEHKVCEKHDDHEGHDHD